MNYRDYRKRFIEREPIVPFIEPSYPATSPASIYYPKIHLSMDVTTLTRNLKTEIITVTTSPSKILEPPHPTCYYIINPSVLLGLTTSFVLFDGTTDVAGNTQDSPLWVSDYLNVHVHITVTDISGTWEFIQQSRDPYTGEWADVQVLGSIDSTGAYYFYIGDRGICTDFALAWNPTAAGSITFSATVTLKEEISGTPYGIGRAIFLGDKTVTPDTGIPILEGQGLKIFPEPDIEIWAIAYTDTTIQVFWL